MHLDTAVEKRNRPPLEGGRRRESEAMRHNAHPALLLLTFVFVCCAHPLHAVALAFVSFGVVLVQVQVHGQLIRITPRVRKDGIYLSVCVVWYGASTSA